MPPFPKRYADRVARLRVPSGFLLVAAFAWFSRPAMPSLAAGVPIALLGLALRGWAAGCLAKNQELATGGPYAYTRNPLYLGTLWLAVLFAVVFALVYLPVIQLEEQHLRSLFPKYAEYAERVPALWPRLGRRAGRGFRWQQYWKNEEYQAGLGLAVGVAFLVWKALR
jgi:protein-S-isoprenylcysteine O-methyltransferase Ste14